jgi:hypothetical protein
MNYTKNYSFDRIIQNYKSFAFLERENYITSENVKVYLNVDVNIRMLTNQAKCFAQNYRSFGDINFHKVLRCRENEVETKLFQMYIYSYVKCLHNGLFHPNISEDANLGSCFRGHCSFYHMLRSPVHMRSDDKDIFVSATLVTGNQKSKRILISYLIASFPFLKEHALFVDSFGTDAFIIPDIERYFNFLNDDYYMTRQGNPSSSDDPDDKEEDIERTSNNGNKNEESSIRTPRKEKTSSNVNRGVLRIVKFDNSNCKQVCFESHYPVLNALCNHGNNEFLFIAPDNGHEAQYNVSFHFSKANFITLARDFDYTFLLDKFYHSKSIGLEDSFLAVHDVLTITGIKGKFFADYPSDVDKQYFIPLVGVDETETLIDDKINDQTPIQDIVQIILTIGTIFEIKASLKAKGEVEGK